MSGRVKLARVAICAGLSPLWGPCQRKAPHVRGVRCEHDKRTGVPLPVAREIQDSLFDFLCSQDAFVSGCPQGTGAAFRLALCLFFRSLDDADDLGCIAVQVQSQRVPREIAAAVHAVLFEGLDPLEAITRLMSRELKGERVG